MWYHKNQKKDHTISYVVGRRTDVKWNKKIVPRKTTLLSNIVLWQLQKYSISNLTKIPPKRLAAAFLYHTHMNVPKNVRFYTVIH